MRFLIIAMVFLCVPLSAHAEGIIVGGGKVNMRSVQTVSDENVVDIYSRQLRYRQSRIAFRRDLEERRKSFARPQSIALSNYERDLIALNQSRQDWRGETQ